MSEEILVNGIDALTGRYLRAPRTSLELAARVSVPPLSPIQRRELAWWVDPLRPKGPFRKPIEGVDPLRLDSSGWAVVFAPDAGGEIREALEPLLKLRRAQAGEDLYREHVEDIGTTPKEKFLADKHAPPGNPNPKKYPYYVLLVGDPSTIPFRFQSELDVQYAVGRLWLETPEDYASYANSVVAAEAKTAPGVGRMTFFGVANDADRPTERLCQNLIVPLAKAFAGAKNWDVTSHVGAAATKEKLRNVLTSLAAPSLLFTGSHGLSFPFAGNPSSDLEKLQLARQGALLCQDWPGPGWEGEVPPEHYFSADDLPPDAKLEGLIAFLFACYSGGTPERDSFSDEPFGEPPRIASSPFVARLPRRLLAQGALAAIAHIDRAWTTSFSWSDDSQPDLFISTLQSIIKGEPLGWAMEYLNVRYAELSVDLNGLLQDNQTASVDQDRLSRLWRAANDARGFLVLGDPAVRLSLGAHQIPASPSPSFP